ncbi:EpsG family protein [Vibrio mytili]|uniref:Polysaccharide polymerase n=1 Tax=Vibrio mytili TaxID=50718 RepID=A0A0C3I547_9VIBR|nr:EpsG family protein [Vibrio mytili]KIN10140.1 hypothetical protein SU60_14820 [Vibrio mytili]
MMCSYDSEIYKNNRRLSLSIFFASVFILFFLAAFRPLGVDADSLGYKYLVDNSNLTELTIEPTFMLLSYFFKLVFDEYAYRGVFVFYALLNLYFLVKVIYDRSCYINVSLATYFLISYFILTFTQIRFSIACSIFILSIIDIVDRRFFKFFIKIAFASLFHFSAVIFIFFYILGSDKFRVSYLFILLVFSFISISFSHVILNILLGNISFLPEYFYYKLYAYLNSGNFNSFNPLNSLSVIVIFFSIVFAWVIVFYDVKFDAFNLTCFKIMVLSVSCFFFFLSFPTLSIRMLNISALMLMYLVPFILSIVVQKRISLILIMVVFFAYFLNQNFVNGLIDVSLLL